MDGTNAKIFWYYSCQETTIEPGSKSIVFNNNYYNAILVNIIILIIVRPQ
jgi:hypothetical protein